MSIHADGKIFLRSLFLRSWRPGDGKPEV